MDVRVARPDAPQSGRKPQSATQHGGTSQGRTSAPQREPDSGTMDHLLPSLARGDCHDPPIQKAYRHLQALSGDELAKREAFVRERALRDAVTIESAAKTEGQASFLHRQLQVKFGELPSFVKQQLKAATPSQLEHWGEQVLTAETLEQVFASR